MGGAFKSHAHLHRWHRYQEAREMAVARGNYWYLYVYLQKGGFGEVRLEDGRSRVSRRRSMIDLLQVAKKKRTRQKLTSRTPTGRRKPRELRE